MKMAYIHSNSKLGIKYWEKHFQTDTDVQFAYQVSENLLMDSFMDNASGTKTWFTGSLSLL